MIKNILFDLDDTILDFKRAEAAALSKTLIKFGVEPTQYIISQYSKYNISQWKRLELGEITREQLVIFQRDYLFLLTQSMHIEYGGTEYYRDN